MQEFPAEESQLLASVETNLRLVLTSRSKQVNYQESYHQLHRLFQLDKCQAVEQLTCQTAHAVFSQALVDLNPETTLVQDFISKLVPFLEGISKTMKIYLFLQSNYFQTVKKTSLSKILITTLRKAVMEAQHFPRFLKQASAMILQARTDNTKLTTAKKLINLLKQFDQQPKSNTIRNHLYPVLTVVLTNTNLVDITTVLENSTFLEFVQEYLRSIRQTREVAEQILGQEKYAQLRSGLLDKCHEQWIRQNLDYIYQPDRIEPLLEANPKLVFEFAKLDQVGFAHFINWCIEKLSNKLNTTPLDPDTRVLILKFSELYNSITTLLKHDEQVEQAILPRVRNTFEKWLNGNNVDAINRFNNVFHQGLVNSREADEEILSVLRFIKDKDVLLLGYKKLLIGRVMTSSVDIERERQMLSKICVEQGEEWGKQPQSLLLDISQSQIFCGDNYQLKVFGDQFWPWNNDIFDWNPPQELEQLMADIQKSYTDVHPKRKLKWHPTLGNATLFIKYQNRRYTVHVPTLSMMVILLVFNTHKQLTVKKLLQLIGYKWVHIQRQIISLSRLGLISVTSEEEGGSINQQTVLQLNNGFSHKEQQFKINSEETEVGSKVFKEELGADRKIMVNGFIVRYMKRNKQAKRKQLVAQIMQCILKKGYLTQMNFVQGCVDQLAGQNYLKVVGDQIIYIP